MRISLTNVYREQFVGLRIYQIYDISIFRIKTIVANKHQDALIGV